MSKKYQIIRPRSVNNSAYEAFEYLLRWIGKDGSDYLYMFYDAELNTKIRTSIINDLDENRIESLIDSEKTEIKLTADNLTKNDLLVIGEMFSNKFVTRLKKDGTIERYAPDSNSFKYTLLEHRYDVSFTLLLPDKPVWK